MTKLIAIIGAGYVGLPLAVAFAEAGRSVICIDSDPAKIAEITAGRSYIEDVDGDQLQRLVTTGKLRASTSYAPCADAAAIVICLPTPLSTNREPDLSIITEATTEIATAPPTRDAGDPRVDDIPGHHARGVAPDPRNLGSARRPGLPPGHVARANRPGPHRLHHPYDAQDRRRAHAASAPSAPSSSIRSCIDTLVPVSSCDAAEMTKLLENIFRSVNIALVNELAMLCDRMSLNVWEIVERGRDQAVRVHALQARPRPGRPLPADRPVLPELEGA